MKRKAPPPYAPPGIKRQVPSMKSRARKARQKRMRSLLAKPQLKYFDTVVAATEANYDASVGTILNGISVGDTDETRDGQTIVMNSLQLKGLLKTADNGDAIVWVRYAIVLDKMPNEAALSSADIWEIGAAASDVYTLRNRGGSAQSRYKVLVDKVVGLDGTGDSVPPEHHMDHYIKLAELCQFNDDGTGNDTDFQRGKLIFFAWSDVAQSATGPTVEFKARLTFYDK